MNISQKHRRTRKTIAQKRIASVKYRWMERFVEQNNTIRMTVQLPEKNETSPVYRWWEN